MSDLQKPIKQTKDEQLLEAAVRLLEYGTFHDNRYQQMSQESWQSSAINVSKQINERLKRRSYANVGPDSQP